MQNEPHKIPKNSFVNKKNKIQQYSLRTFSGKKTREIHTVRISRKITFPYGVFVQDNV